MKPQRLSAFVTGLSSLSLLSVLALACQSTPATGPDNSGDGGDGGDSAKGGTGGSHKGGSGGIAAKGGSGGQDEGGSGGTAEGGSGNGMGGSEAGGSAGGGAHDASAPDAAGDHDAAPDGGGTGSPDCTTALPKSLFCNPLGKMPLTIKETGIFPSAPDLSKHPASMFEFLPDPPLWSDGMDKLRFLLLPYGQKINNTDPKQWVFPKGTVLIKTFFDDTGPGGKPRPIETRFIRRIVDPLYGDYDFYLYKWNAAGTDADLVLDNMEGDPNATVDVTITINHMKDGKPFMVNGGKPFAHTLPSRQMCSDCHDENGNNGRQTFIGFDEPRLNSKLTPAAAKTQLQDISDKGMLLMPARTTPETITDTTNDGGRLLRIKRFVFGNCVHCHNGGKVFDMNPDKFVANTVNKDTESQSVMPPPGWKRVLPGKPEMSVLYVQARRTPLPPAVGGVRLRPMPPVGVSDLAPDQTALTDIAAWITSLPAK
jgi:hypothetical protein